MADRIKVSFGALDTAVSDLNAGVQQMGQRMQQLRSDVAPMLATWDGAAQQSYAAAQQQWDSGWTDLQAALGQLQQATAQSTDDYKATEQAAARSFHA
jgi:6 kDa early secretory antigenic target